MRRSNSSAGSKAFIDPERKPSRSRVTNLKPEALKILRELRRHRGIERPLQLLARNFNADDFPVMPHAELPEAQRAQRVLAVFDHLSASRVTGRPYSMRDDRQADAGLSQMRSPALPSQRANLLLCEPRIQQRSHNMVRCCRFLSRAKIPLVVQIDPVRDRVESARHP